MENGIVKGCGDGTFAPDKPATREEVAVILYRYYNGAPVEEDHLAAFPDADTVALWAVTEMNWAVANGLIKGTVHSGGSVPYLDAGETATRGQAATLLYRAMNK